MLSIFNMERPISSPDENHKVEKLKESHLLLKKKLSLSHELIKQYNDKIKECQAVNNELEIAKHNVETITQKHNSSLIKITQLGLENDEYRQKIDNFSKTISDQEIKIAADRQHVQQLICKMREAEQIHTAKSKKEDNWKEKIKLLETKLKEVKKSHEIEIKEMEMQMNVLKTAGTAKNQNKKETKITHEKSTCTGNELEPVIFRAKMVDKCVLTNDFYSIKDDPYPLFCTKCEVKLDPAPLNQILNQMSTCPVLITEVTSPPRKPVITRLHTNPQDSAERELVQPEAINDSVCNLSQNLERAEKISDISKSDFERLERKICLLERKLQKTVKKDAPVRNQCSSCQYLKNCYAAPPYPNVFQSGTMMQTQAEFLEFQNWQQGLINRKRRWPNNIQKSSRRGKKLANKKQKLQDSTTGWHIDPIPVRELGDLNHGNMLKKHSEASNDRLRAESPLLNCQETKIKSSKRSKKRTKELLSLFSASSRGTSPSHSDLDSDVFMDEQLCQKKQMESPKTEEFMDQEIVKNSDRPSEHVLEHEPVQFISNEQTKSVEKPAQKSTKLSFIKKISNLKKSSSITEPPMKNFVSVNNKKSHLVPTKVSIENADVNGERGNDVGSPKLVENETSLNVNNDYSPVKKHRIAHTTRKPENRSIYGMISNSSKLPKIIEPEKSLFKDKSVSNNTMDNSENEHVGAVEVSNGCVGDTENTSHGTDFNSQTRLVGENRSNDISDTEFSSLASKPSVTCSNGNIDESISNDCTNTRQSTVNKSSVNKEVISLQPCIVIPRMYFDVGSVANSCNAMQCSESIETRKDSPVPNSDQVSKSNTPLRILRSKTIVNRSNSTASSSNEPTQAIEDTVNKNFTSNKPKTISRITKVDLASHSDVIHSPDFPDNDDVLEVASDVHDTSISVKSDECEDSRSKTFDNENSTPILARRTYNKRRRVDALSPSPIRELRSRSILLSPSKNSLKHDNEEPNNETASNATDLATCNVNMQYNKGFSPISLLQQYLVEQANIAKEKSSKRKKFNEKVQQKKENLVLKELSELVENEEWTTTMLANATEKLSHFKKHTIAKCTVDFLCTKAEENELLDRTYTPPAPILSKTQQRIITMLVVLNRTIPDLIRLVQTGIEYRLFRLGYAPEVEVVQELTRAFTALARVQKDREKVRILCCDALYCLGKKAIPLVYTILISWPEVLPMAGTSNEPLLLCLTQAIGMQDGDTSFPKFLPLKKLLSGYYNYTFDDPSCTNLTKSFMTALKDKRQNGLDTAIILLAKKKGTSWAYKNIVQGGLLQMIIERIHPSIYDAFCLLGYIMRSFSVNDPEGLVKNILEQLCALMESGEGSMQQQEGVATALLSLSRHKLDVVVKALLNWKPCEPISEPTIRLLTNLFRVHQPGYWHKLIQKNCRKLPVCAKM
ncbi:uncharacterized protein LOC124416593 isoform X2 [Diprion similis]|uniref:uncharacterized protein LOC124416593 isoform X2 n=1 Tax=Diprion similis TaxID=362088 RepID=UPI001EF99392|nr:uncharacterized protein LOC124416593 isoform X2 [Diprion similis]